MDEGTTLAARQITINPNRLTQMDGTIELGSGGLQTSVAGSSAAPHADLQRGTLKATADFTKNLKAIEVVIDGRAGLEEYPLCAAGETTAEDAAAIVVTAHTTTGKPETGWRAVVKADGQLVLRNPKPSGFAVFLR